MQYSFARYEQKYFLTPAQLTALLARIAPHIQRDAHARYTICNLYYDTDDWRLIRASLEKPIYKEKLRVRSYGVPADGDGVFAEIKKKYAGVVYKRTTALDLRRGDYGTPLLLPGQILMELKLPDACPLWLSRALTDIGARPTSFSKYGACYKTCILPTETFSKEALCSA